MAASIRSRIERLEERHQPFELDGDGYITISPFGEDGGGGGPYLIARIAEPGPFKRVPEGLLLNDPRGLSFIYNESCREAIAESVGA